VKKSLVSLLWIEKSLLDRSEVQGGSEGEMCFRAQGGVPAGRVARLQFASFLQAQPPIGRRDVKWTVSRDVYFFGKSNILISTYCACADGFQGLSKALHYPIHYTIISFLFVSLKLLNNFQNAC
jgi:hypothetical protein